jgi:two-component system, NtrC family, sensor kinase
MEPNPKLEVIGQLALGIAHEVNTPTQYVSDNVSFLQRAFDKLLKLVEAQAVAVEAARAGGVSPETLEAVDSARTAVKLDYLARQVPRAIDQSLQGLGQISAIVKAMKDFSRPTGSAMQPFDLHDLIESATIVAKNEWQYVAELQLDFDWSLPPVLLWRSEFAQVLLNLIVNGAQAIGAALPANSAEKGRLVIATKAVGPRVEVRVSDSGTGTPAAAERLALAHSAVVDKHGGSLNFEAKEGRGTTFIVSLPLAAA